jgi:replicative DNA helicase
MSITSGGDPGNRVAETLPDAPPGLTDAPPPEPPPVVPAPLGVGDVAADLVPPSPADPIAAAMTSTTDAAARAREDARRYLAEGRRVVPLRFKRPWDATRSRARDDWPTLKLTADDVEREFTGAVTGVGVILGAPSGNLVDVDLDCPEALAAADRLLTPTCCVFGRPSARRSHREFILDTPVPTIRFKDCDADKTTLLELRGTGGQSVFPHSLHESGEIVSFDEDGAPTHVSTTDLQRAVAVLAATTLLARHWPRQSGSRHDLALALAGYLLRGGLDAEMVRTIVETAARIAGDPEVSDRVAAGASTAAALVAGRPATGGPTLADLLSAGVVAKLTEWLGVKAGMTAAWEPLLPFHTPRLPRFPLDVLLPTWLRACVAAEAEATQTPVDLVAMIALAVIALTIAGKVDIQVEPDWVEPVNLFATVVQPPGTRKSAVMAHMTAPLERWEARQHAAVAPLIAEFEARREIAEQVLKRALKEAAVASAEKRPAAEQHAQALARELAAMHAPVVPRLLADDISPEKFASLLRDHGGRMAVVSPEGDLFDLMGGRYSKGSAPNFGVFLKGHAGDPVRVDRVGRPPEWVSRPAVTLGLAVQPDVLAGLASKPGFRGRGLLGRFLYALPPSLLGTRRIAPPAVPDNVRTAYDAKIEALLGISVNSDDRGQFIAHELKLSPAARRRLAEFQQQVEMRLGESGDLGHMTDWGGKLVGAAARIAGVLHMAQHVPEALRAPDTAVHAASESWKGNVADSTIEAAVRLADYYLVPHAKAAFAQMGADPAVEGAQRVLRWIKRSGVRAFSKRDAFQATKGCFKRVKELDPALEVLGEHGYLRDEPESDKRPGPGRKASPRFEVNPRVFEASGDSEDTENSENPPRHPDEPRSPTLENSGNSEGEADDPKGMEGGDVTTNSSAAPSAQNSHNPQNSDQPPADGEDDGEDDWEVFE